MKKVVICNGWSDLNTGDSSIIISMIKRIKNTDNSCNISIISELHKENKFYNNSIDFIKESYPGMNINLVGSIFYKKYTSKKYFKVKEIASFLKCFIIEKLPKKLYKIINKNNKYYKTIAEGDVILSKGGHFLLDRGGIKGYIHLYKCVYPMLIAKKFGKKYSIISQSIGPFNFDNKFFSKMSLKLIKKILNNANSISLREEQSLIELDKLNLTNKDINLTSDYAFKLETSKIDLKKFSELDKIMKLKDFVVITIRQHNFKKSSKEEYMKTINKIAKRIYDKHKLNVVFMPHVQGPNSFENDCIAVKEFKENYDKQGKYYYIKEFYSPQVIKEFYSNAKILIGTRFHSVIFGLSSDVPCFAISYSGYKAYIMKQVGMLDYMLNIEEFNSKNYDTIEKKIDELIIENEKYKKMIFEKRKNIDKMILSDKAFLKNFSSKLGKKNEK